jgi:hypothetical protein
MRGARPGNQKRRVPSQIFAAAEVDGNVDAVSEMFF